MPSIKPLFVGEVKFGINESLFTSHKATRQVCTSDLNSWLFDFTHSTGKTIVQLPPLDDWCRSEEDSTLWFFKFNDLNITVSIKTETIEFP